MPDETGPDETGPDETGPELASRPSTIRRALIGGIAVVVALAVVFGWFGQQAWRDHSADRFRQELLDAGKQGAVNLTTIDYARAEADVQRVLDTSTGQFRADFKSRSIAFIDVVKKAESKSFGTVTEAAVESVEGKSGQVLVAIAVKTKTRGVEESQPRYWRMRLTVTKDGSDSKAKVSKVEFVR
jgi:Mce-associated membrane protein